MPIPSLSLVGFLDQRRAIDHLKSVFMAPKGDDAALIREWHAAIEKLGPPRPHAGNSDIAEIPSSHHGYIAKLRQVPWVASELEGPRRGGDFRMVEIDPLLSYQCVLEKPRADQLCGALSKPPTLDELLSCCLPMLFPTETLNWSPQNQSIIVRCRNMNFRIQKSGHIAPNALGVVFGLMSPLVDVVRYGGRCYLRNGYHRAYGARLAGATHIPCLFRDVPDYASVGMTADFSADLFESANPPTLGHFTGGRAHDVVLRSRSRLIQVSWSEHEINDE